MKRCVVFILPAKQLSDYEGKTERKHEEEEHIGIEYCSISIQLLSD